MAVRIRLTRVGATKRPSYRVVAIDSRKPRDGRALEILGFYDPLTDPATVKIDADRLTAWISKGASPSDTVQRLMRQAGIGGAAPLPAAADKPKAKAADKPADKGGDKGADTAAKKPRAPRARKAPAAASATAEE